MFYDGVHLGTELASIWSKRLTEGCFKSCSRGQFGHTGIRGGSEFNRIMPAKNLYTASYNDLTALDGLINTESQLFSNYENRRVFTR